MKIIHIVLGKANPERMNGINRIVHELASTMVEAQLDVEVWGITADPESRTPERDYPLRLFALGTSRLRISPELERDLIALGQDARVHLHGALLPQFGIVTRVLRQHGVPYVITPHGAYSSVALERKSLAKRVYISLVDESVMRGASAIQVNSEFEARELEKRLPGLPIEVIPNGQRLHASRSSQASSEFEFAYCGRLDQSHKGLDLLIDGFNEYRSDGGNGRLTIIGEGPDDDALRKRASSQGDAVEFTGALFGDEKLRRIAAADAFVHTSRHEGMPMAVLEAAGIGLPLILSRATNLAECVEDSKAGLIVDPNTPSQIARAMFLAEELHSVSQLEELGRNARNMIAEGFSWDDVTKRIVRDIYHVDRGSREVA